MWNSKRYFLVADCGNCFFTCSMHSSQAMFVFAVGPCFWKKLKLLFFCFKLIFFLCVFGLFWCADVKNKFLKKIKKIILIHFEVKSTSKSNRYHNAKHYLNSYEGTLRLFILFLVFSYSLLCLLCKPRLREKSAKRKNLSQKKMLNYLLLKKAFQD